MYQWNIPVLYEKLQIDQIRWKIQDTKESKNGWNNAKKVQQGLK